MTAVPSCYATLVGVVMPAQSFGSGVVEMPVARGRFMVNHGAALGRQLLSTDPLGTATLTLTNVAPGSRYRIERQGDGSLATPAENADGTAAGSTVSIALNYYVPGNANNALKLKLIDLGYEIEEVNFTIGPAGYPIQSQRRPDPWYSNPT